MREIFTDLRRGASKAARILVISVWLGGGDGPARGASPAPIDLSRHFSYPVTQVIDGDTIVIRTPSRGGVLMQLRGIKADRPAAKRFLQELLSGELIHLVYAPGGTRDRAGHLAAYFFRVRDKLFVNQEILEQGYGITNDDDGPHERLFTVIEDEAESAGRGLWGREDLRERLEPTAQAREQWARTIEQRAARLERWRNWNNAAEIEALELAAASEVGTSVLTVRNNRDAKVRVILRGAFRPVSMIVPAGVSRSVSLLNGQKYRVFLRYGDEPRSLYEGDPILIDDNDPTLTIAAQQGGNYAVRQVR
jgi:endonuclease YncB( thermonuclease family)